VCVLNMFSFTKRKIENVVTCLHVFQKYLCCFYLFRSIKVEFTLKISFPEMYVHHVTSPLSQSCPFPSVRFWTDHTWIETDRTTKHLTSLHTRHAPRFQRLWSRSIPNPNHQTFPPLHCVSWQQSLWSHSIPKPKLRTIQPFLVTPSDQHSPDKCPGWQDH
jgi:hypothetical protein